MGTRSLTILHDTDGTEIAVLYRQFDGYLSGHGAELKDFLEEFTITNGISERYAKHANGGSCLAAQIVAHFKEEVGHFYLHPAGVRDYGEEYRYHIYPFLFASRSGIKVTVESGYGNKWEPIYEGNIEDMPTTE